MHNESLHEKGDWQSMAVPFRHPLLTLAGLEPTFFVLEQSNEPFRQDAVDCFKDERQSYEFRNVAAIAATLTLLSGAPVAAQTTHETKVDHDTSVKNGVATTKTKVTETTKRKTHRPKKVLGVKVGHKTVKHKIVHETAVSSDGDRKTSVKTN